MMFNEKFGFFPKKSVSLSNSIVSINKFDIPIDRIKCIYVHPFDLTKNEWGSVYFSDTGEDYTSEEYIGKYIFKYTKKQTDKVWELLNQIDAPIIEKNQSEQNIASAIDKRIVTCPHCSSRNVQFMQNDRKSFSIGKAAAGAVLTGGVGVLAGFAGKKGDNEFFCQNCNRTFIHA